MRPLAVLRPEPGNKATCERIRAGGGIPLALPLFIVRPLEWRAPPAERFDALFLTSANAVRHGGVGLETYRGLPVFAVGEATAAAARMAGLTVAAVGTRDAAELAGRARAHGVRRALRLAGHDRATIDRSGVAETIAVYASEARTPTPAEIAALAGSVALLHSPRAAARLAALVPDRSTVRLAAISPATLAAAGPGWATADVAAVPDDAALIATAFALAA